MTESHDLPRQMAIFALTSLSEPLRADVLADGTLARQFDLHLTQPIKLDDLVLRRDQLGRGDPQEVLLEMGPFIEKLFEPAP